MRDGLLPRFPHHRVQGHQGAMVRRLHPGTRGAWRLRLRWRHLLSRRINSRIAASALEVAGRASAAYAVIGDPMVAGARTQLSADVYEVETGRQLRQVDGGQQRICSHLAVHRRNRRRRSDVGGGASPQV